MWLLCAVTHVVHSFKAAVTTTLRNNKATVLINSRFYEKLYFTYGMREGHWVVQSLTLGCCIDWLSPCVLCLARGRVLKKGLYSGGEVLSHSYQRSLEDSLMSAEKLQPDLNIALQYHVWICSDKPKN